MTAEIPPAPQGAHRLFGGRVACAEAFTAILADTGVSHGLIGPREVPILWDRHVLNCAVIEDAFAPDARVIDVGSGAGLPGIAVAIARPDLDIHLVEPMLRRTEWLTTTVQDLGLDNVTVHRGRAEEFHDVLQARYVTARAVARLDKLARWCLPLVEPGGSMIAMKGRAAAEELESAAKMLRRLGVTRSTVTPHGEGLVDEPTLTVDSVKGSSR
ncbi:16S rRNA (guanine(527)-N(7))-methyltransferase RsmG [Janibacter sp. Soil728]|uniref:16S rRNA (guanine(527)-N(7))-methyltransferase RsmG n=1 Tax=Janibacter sp. Soil728 TaxID=1736393 RepID=UPI000702226E|nr:16S rRNA (guanine(527)-N(7))-methyltransferase RsmG [Janibacter sp. Soil728]KRE39076.1 16S rRNA (guanine(527)-N(7))-methyltransferase RsmG [Janibacter sp. Soil728]